MFSFLSSCLPRRGGHVKKQKQIEGWHPVANTGHAVISLAKMTELQKQQRNWTHYPLGTHPITR